MPQSKYESDGGEPVVGAHIAFRASHEPQPNDATARRFAQRWPLYREWFLKHGAGDRPRYLSCRKALQEHLPELVPLWETISELVGGGDLEARMLSLYRPSPYLHGCSQAVWNGSGAPALVRNYDYDPQHCEGAIVCSEWSGVKCIVQSDTLWGVLDGMNEHGLAVSLAFGGRTAHGDGFGIPLILRYILEFCEDTAGASRVLGRVPSHRSYNVLLLDRSGQFANVHVSPDRPPFFSDQPAATNHQREIEWTAHAERSRSLERERFLLEHCREPDEERERFFDRFLEPPLFSREWSSGFGTLYTAIYSPEELSVEYRWRNHTWRLGFDDFDESTLLVRYR